MSKIIEKLDDAYWACYRFIRDSIFQPVWYRIFGHKHHIVKTVLPPSPWYDTDTRMLYAVMELVRWFVDNDMHIWDIADRNKEIESTKEVFKDDPEQMNKILDNFKDQMDAHDGIFEIYRWWNNYPNREREIGKARNEWHNYVVSLQSNKDSIINFFDTLRGMNEEQTAKERELGKITDDLEEKLENETTEMLKKAIELRGAMWS